jgi:hypothetical protein
MTSDNLFQGFANFLNFMKKCCEELPSNIYFVGNALQEIFLGEI